MTLEFHRVTVCIRSFPTGVFPSANGKLPIGKFRFADQECFALVGIEHVLGNSISLTEFEIKDLIPSANGADEKAAFREQEAYATGGVGEAFDALSGSNIELTQSVLHEMRIDELAISSRRFVPRTVSHWASWSSASEKQRSGVETASSGSCARISEKKESSSNRSNVR